MGIRGLPPLPRDNVASLAAALDLRLAELDRASELLFKGSGSPEGVVVANVGSVYQRTDGGAEATFFVKESGTGNTGWVASGDISLAMIGVTGSFTTASLTNGSTELKTITHGLGTDDVFIMLKGQGNGGVGTNLQ